MQLNQSIIKNEVLFFFAMIVFFALTSLAFPFSFQYGGEQAPS